MSSILIGVTNFKKNKNLTFSENYSIIITENEKGKGKGKDIMAIGVYVGSFDPFTNGHFEVLNQAVNLFDKVYIGVGINPDKKPLFSDLDRMEMIQLTVKRNYYKLEQEGKIVTEYYEGLTASFLKEIQNANQRQQVFLIRGLRNSVDYGYEENLASANEMIMGIKTIYLRAGKRGAISSSLIRQLWLNGDWDIIENLVPIDVYSKLRIFSNKKV